MVEKILISSGSPFEQSVGFSRAVRVDDRILVAGTAPIWSDGGVDPDPGVQAARCLEIIGEALEDAGASFDDVVRTRTYLTNAADWEAVAAEHGKVFSEIRPASTMVVVVGMLDPRWKV
ncbi:MAG: RidA family protein, partial [Acidimicrobiia bacterium]